MITINKQKSTVGGPFCFYTLTLTSSNRMANSITITAKIDAQLEYPESFLHNPYVLTANVIVNNITKSVVLKQADEFWDGNTIVHTKTITLNVNNITPTTITLSNSLSISVTGPDQACALNTTNGINLTIPNFQTNWGYIIANNTFRPITDGWIIVNNQWKKIINAWITVNNQWKKIL